MACGLLATVVPVSASAAQSDPAFRRAVASDPAKESEPPSCYERGRAYASDTVSSTPNFFGGLAGGFLLGLIGTAIVYAVTSEPAPTNPALRAANESGCESATWLEGYGQGEKSKKRTSALGGGLLGTAVIVALILSAGGS